MAELTKSTAIAMAMAGLDSLENADPFLLDVREVRPTSPELVTLLSVIGLTKPFMSALDEERFMSVFRVGAMILTGVLAMTIFIQSFIRNRRKNKM